MPAAHIRCVLPALLLAVGCAAAAEPKSKDKTQKAVKGPKPENTHDPRNPDGSFKYTNRLAKETSPYLLQHAHNPVNWYPWGDEAFALAKKENKPVFLSIGYSTCHWCHVMEKESFANEEVAKILNADFICIKVDREERPDVDHIYMQAVMLMGRGGGWPLTAFLKPDRKPFFGGTYFPPEDARGLPGLKKILASVIEAWKDPKQKAEIDQAGEEAARALRTATLRLVGGVALGAETLGQAAERFKRSFDPEHGGFGGLPRYAPKFPRTHAYSWLLRCAARTGDKALVDITAKSLDAMSRGGIYDHLGGGFHRYSVDRQWLVPHFEKMLYDQALIARTYLEAFQVTGNADYARVARETFDYVLRDMTGAGGGFYSAEDADSEGVEGKFYVWTRAEIATALGADADLFCRFYGVGDKPNFEEAEGSILHVTRSVAEFAAAEKRPADEIAAKLAAGRGKLLSLRGQRIRPHLDDKILAGWNGLMIAALAFGHQTLGEEKYLKAAERAADFVLTRMRRPDGRLLVAWRADKADKPAYIDDYAFLADGLFELYQSTGDPVRLKQCVELTEAMLKLFADDDGGFTFSGKDGEKLIAETKELYDGAIPSGNSVAAGLLLKLGKLTMNDAWSKAGAKVFTAFAHQIVDQPQSFPHLLSAYEFHLGPTWEIVVAGDPASAEVKAMLAVVRKRFLPNKVVALRPSAGPALEAAVALVPFLKEQGALGGKPTAYVCRNYVCQLPVHTAAEVERHLSNPPKPAVGPVLK